MKLITDRAATLFAQRVDVPVTSAQSRVMMYLEACGGGPVSQKELETYLNVTHTTAKGLLQRLEEKGYVRTAFDSPDGRVKNAYITEKARSCREGLEEHVCDITGQMMQGLSEEEETQLVDLLKRIYHNVK